MTKEVVKQIVSCGVGNQPPRARVWAFHEMTKRWEKNRRDGRNGWFNSHDVTLFLEANVEKYYEFLEKNNLEKFPYDVYLSPTESDGKDNRTEW